MPMIRERLLNVGLRVTTIIGRSLLLFVLARYLEPDQVGLYGLIGATVGYMLYLVGFDFYAYTNRELIGSSKAVWGKLFKSQFVLFCMVYTVVLPVSLIIFQQELLPWALALWFFALLPIEHLNQELSRLLIVISRPILASVIIFLRGGAWCILIAVLFVCNESVRSLEVVFSAWLLGGLMAAGVGLASIRGMRLGGWGERVDWLWIGRGIKVALPLLIATLALRGVFTIDRYWFEHLAGIDVLAAYVVYMAVGGMLMAFLDAGVFAFHYPALIRTYNNGEPDLFRKELLLMFVQTVLFSVAFVVFVRAILPIILVWLDNPIYTEHYDLLGWIVFAMVLYSVSMVPHFALYAQGHDRPVIFSHFAVLLCFMLTVWHFSMPGQYMAVPYALCAAFAVMLVLKTLAYVVLTPNAYRIPIGFTNKLKAT